MPYKRKKLFAILFSLFITGCVAEQALKPLNSESTSAVILAKDPASDAFQQHLIEQGYPADQLPFKEWGVDELTICALYYHTKLDVAKQQLTLANLSTEVAKVKKNPTLNAELARTNQKNGDLKPWSYGLSIDIPIETANKRTIQIEIAERHAEIIRMNVAEMAWEVRNQLATDLITYHQNIAETQLIQQELNIQTNIANLLEKRVRAGIASKTQLSHANLLVLQTKHRFNNQKGQLNQIKAKLAADVGLTPEKFALINIKPLSIVETLAQQTQLLNEPLESKTLQAQALLNRIDIRRSLAKYALAETEIKQKVAEQTPDITLSPGILFDFGDKIWSLGFSSLLNMLHKNTALIEEAKQLREVEGAQFANLQAEVIAKISQAHAHYLAAKLNAEQAALELKQQLTQTNKIQKQFDAGLIGQLDLVNASHNNIVAKQQLVASQFELLRSTNQIEDIMQKPLYTDFKLPVVNFKKAN